MISDYIRQPGSRKVIIAHGHIFKNAGSTFDWALKNNFGSCFYDHRDDKDMIHGKAKYLARFLKKNKNIIAISSHHLCMPLPKIANTKIIPAFIFRHPIERIRSVYLFERKQTERTPGSIHAKKYNFKQYVEWRMQPDINATIKDFQVRFITGTSKPQHLINKKNVAKAKQVLIDYSLVGIVDRYDESMVVFEDYLKKYFPMINLAYIRQNVSQANLDMSVEEKKNKVLAELGNLADRVLANNEADLALYQFANNLLDEHRKRISNFFDKLADFRSRCAALHV